MSRNKQERYSLNIARLQKDCQLSNLEMGMKLLMPVSSYVLYKKSGYVTLKVLRRFYAVWGSVKIKKYMENKNGK